MQFKYILPVFLLFYSLQGKADTTLVKLTYNGELAQTDQEAFYSQKSWPEADKWRVQKVRIASQKLLYDGYYADSAFTIKSGVFKTYHANGIPMDSCNYVLNKLMGLRLKWREDGTIHIKENYFNDLPVDSNFTYGKNGNISKLMVTDSSGNGFCTEYHSNGKIESNGSILAGERQGKWSVYNIEGLHIMDVDLIKGSVVNTTCYLPNSPCIFEQLAYFKGGHEAWKRFLNKNIKYPVYAEKNNIKGLVRVQFVILKDGCLGDFLVIETPHESLSEAVINLMKESPRWQPSIRYNQPIITRYIQSMTFNLR